MILAAGAGSRYGGLKQLSPVGPSGETLLEYSVFDALRAGFSRVVLVVRPEHEPDFRRRFDSTVERRAPITYVHQTSDDLPNGFRPPPGRVKPWGTGHAVLATATVIDGPFAVLNADDFYGAESFATLSAFLNGTDRSSDIALVGFRVDQTLTDAGPVSRAVCRFDEHGLLYDVVERSEVWRRDDRVVYRDDDGAESELRGDELVSMNSWGFPAKLFPHLRRCFRSFLDTFGEDLEAEFLLPDVVRSLVREGVVRVGVLRGSGPWCGMTFREDEPRVRGMIAGLVDQGSYPGALWT